MYAESHDTQKIEPVDNECFRPPRYSLITLSHNKLETTRRCLSGILTHTLFDDSAELIAVDNGSQDGSKDWLARELPRLAASHNVSVRTIFNDRNIGCSTARNQALEIAGGRYIVFLDNDVEPRTMHWLPLLRARIEAGTTIGMAGAKMIYPWSPYRIQCAGVGISKRGHVCFRGRGEDRRDRRFNRAEPVQCLISACLMMRGELIRRHGGFDEVFNPVQFEDFDLCYRLREQGWEAWYEPAAEMYHLESTTTQGTPSVNNASVVIRNGLRFQNRWRHCFEREAGPSEEACRWHHLSLHAPEPPDCLPRDAPCRG